MADPRVPSQQTNHLLENPFPPPALYQPHGNIQQRVAVRCSHRIPHGRSSPFRLILQNPYVAGDDQQGVDREGVLQPIRNVVIQGQMQPPHHIDATHYNAARYHLPPQPVSEILWCNTELPFLRLHLCIVSGGSIHASASGCGSSSSRPSTSI